MNISEFTEFTVNVDFSSTMEDMITLSNCKRVHPDISLKRFPIPEGLMGKKMKVVAKLVPHNYSYEKLKKDGFCEAGVHILLAVAAKYPGLQKEFLIIANGIVGKFANGYDFTPYLRCVDDVPEVELNPFTDGKSPYQHRLVFKFV